MSRSRLSGAALAITLLVANAGAAEAQYFGSNKIQYANFDFRVLQTRHFDIYYYPQEQEGAVHAARLAERWYARLSALFQHDLHARQPVILYASHPDFRQTNLVDGEPGEGTGGFTESAKNRIVMPFGVGLAETSHVLGHELVHAFQYDLARHGNGGIVAMPLWFIEGMAEYVSLGSDDRLTAMWMRDIVQQGTLPSVGDLGQARYFPYRYGQAMWTYLAGRFGEDIVRRMLMVKGATVKTRVKAGTGLTLEQLSKDWQEWLRKSFPANAAGGGPTPALHRMIAPTHGSRLALAPSLSPDGSQMVFLSERDQFSVDAYLADARTGAIVRKIVSTATDPHFDSLQFVDSSGAWDPAGRRFVFAAVASGKPVLVIDDVKKGVTEREIALSDLGQVFQPAWSPDGRRLAFSGLKDGLSDLYVYDLETNQRRQITSDPFTDVQPAWSPDGRRLAFVTDRFSSDIATLQFGPYRIATMDADGGNIQQVPGFPATRSINPQWSADGASLFFLSDPSGITNVYRVELTTGEVRQVTDVRTGVSGITRLSPALSVARNGARLAFSLYERGRYEICDLATPAALAGDAVDTDPAHRATGVLTQAAIAPGADDAATAPAPAGGTDATSAPGGGLDPSDFTVKRYRRALALDRVGQPYVSAGGGQFGSFFQAGIAFSAGDMLRDQQLGLALQVGRHVEDYAGRFVYLNRRSRWNWGVDVQYLPVVLGQSEASVTGPASAPTVSTRVDYWRQTHTGVSGIAIYPFDRADRLELSAGFRNVAFARDVRTQVMALTSGHVTSNTIEKLAAPPPVNFIESSVAFVHDTAVLGPTSPVVGSRYRLELAPSMGDLSFATVVADYRRYVIPVRPFTLAFRGRYLGRVGRDAADTRLIPLVLGLRDEVRGYDLGSVLARPCAPSAGATRCSAIDMLSGSQLFVANVEVRFPLRGLLSGNFDYGRLPLEGLVFADAGRLSTRQPGPDGMVWRQDVLRSIGAGVRVNVAGIVFEFDAVRPSDLRGAGWTFSFNLKPGF